jgi:hypothetical protein
MRKREEMRPLAGVTGNRRNVAMNKRDDRGRLGLRSERLRQLTGVPDSDLGQVAGGTVVASVPIERDSAGRVYSRTCCFS